MSLIKQLLCTLSLQRRVYISKYPKHNKHVDVSVITLHCWWCVIYSGGPRVMVNWTGNAINNKNFESKKLSADFSNIYTLWKQIVRCILVQYMQGRIKSSCEHKPILGYRSVHLIQNMEQPNAGRTVHVCTQIYSWVKCIGLCNDKN